MEEDTNNELLHQIAGVDQDEHKTNNQLLEIIAANSGGGGGTGIVETVSSDNGTILVNSDDPANPVLSFDGSGYVQQGQLNDTVANLQGNIDGKVSSIVAGDGITIDASDNQNPIISSSGGGQNIYEAIVGNGDGEYTTLGAALAVASSIYVRDGTWTETGNITSSTTGVVIVGESANAIVELGSYNLTLSGANARISNLNMKLGTGVITMSGINATIRQCFIDKTNSANALVKLTANNATFEYNTVTDASTQTSEGHIQFKAMYAIFQFNKITYVSSGTTIANAFFSGTVACYHAQFIGNQIERTSGSGAVLGFAFSDGLITKNTFNGSTGSGDCIILGDYNMIISDNFATSFGTFFDWEGSFDRRSVMVHGNTLFSMSNAIHLDGCHDVSIIGNNISGSNPSVIENESFNNMIIGNRFRTGDLTLGSTTKANHICNNVFNTNTAISDSGTGNIKVNNTYGTTYAGAGTI